MFSKKHCGIKASKTLRSFQETNSEQGNKIDLCKKFEGCSGKGIAVPLFQDGEKKSFKAL